MKQSIINYEFLAGLVIAIFAWMLVLSCGAWVFFIFAQLLT